MLNLLNAFSFIDTDLHMTNVALHRNHNSRYGIPETTIMIIFGGTGDLTRRKLMPALYHLSRENLLPTKFHTLGLGRRIPPTSDYIQQMQLRVMQYCSHNMEDQFWDPIGKHMESLRADYQEIETYNKIREKIETIEQQWGMRANKLFYFATAPSHFGTLVDGLAKVNLHKQSKEAWSRIIVEKPFGLDLKSAEVLNQKIMEYFSEDQIFRIDHFLGKEAIQNILVFRTSNIMFQPLWNREYIDHIQITTSETVGVEGRLPFFEQTGAVLDMIQSHLLQILALLTMEHPESLDQEKIRDEKVILLKSVRKYPEENIGEYVVRGQYDQGVVLSEFVKAYRDEKNTPEDSLIETYAAMKLYIDNYRWRGVPFYLRTGKRMPTRLTEILIQLKPPKFQIPTIIKQQQEIKPNMIKIIIQPKAGINLEISWKPPGIISDVEPILLNIGGEARLKEPKAYERLMLDAIRGDSTLFIRYDEIREMFKIIDPFIRYFRTQDELIRKGELDDPFPNYSAGMQGPAEADEFIRRDNREWTPIE